MRTTTLTMIDGVRVVVPDSLDQITPYVLHEQLDWFEDEIRFLRVLLKAGNRVIDVGANHGVYALSMAEVVGPTGGVWAFEPAVATASLLENSNAINGFQHVQLDRMALSDHIGEAELSVSTNSELNALARGSAPAGPTETIALTTLDVCMERHEWRDIDLLKIDAKGEEVNILKGGKKFFSELSPLVLYEIRAGADLQLGLVQAFAALGYRSYRLVPGLGLLIPIDSTANPDNYLLNLFACKADRADLLASQGRLVSSTEDGTDPDGAPVHSANERHVSLDWRKALGHFPYALNFAPLDRTLALGGSADVGEALVLYARSRDKTRTPAQRLSALQASLPLLKLESRRPTNHLRLASLARVAADFGERELAVSSLTQLFGDMSSGKQIDPSKPFLAPGARFESLPPGEALGNWVLAATIEECERLASHSSLIAGDMNKQLLELIATLGFGSDETKRRLRLVQQRFSPSRDTAGLLQ